MLLCSSPRHGEGRGWGGALSQSTSDFVLGAWIDDVLEVESWALVGLFNAAADINALEQ